MKIFLTGDKGVGKSTCINEIIKECVISVTGFQTLPFCENGIRKGFYMHSLVDVEKNDIRFSIQKPFTNETIPNIFNDFGVRVLEESCKHKDSFLILDEIGYLEHNEELYLNALQEVIDKFDNIIGVLRKCDIKYIVDIKKRKDVIILDFDQLSCDEVKAKLKHYVEESK